jgi:hypothetical protein
MERFKKIVGDLVRPKKEGRIIPALNRLLNFIENEVPINLIKETREEFFASIRETIAEETLNRNIEEDNVRQEQYQTSLRNGYIAGTLTWAGFAPSNNFQFEIVEIETKVNGKFVSVFSTKEHLRKDLFVATQDKYRISYKMLEGK